MRGPVNPSTNYECGLLVEGFDLDPTLMMVWNPSYYGEFLERYGLRKAADMYASQRQRLFGGKAAMYKAMEHYTHGICPVQTGHRERYWVKL